MLFFYIRHGTPTYSPDALTPLGKRQAEAIGKRLALYGIDSIYSSTSNRAYETAIPLSEMLGGKEITQLDFANESHAWKQLTVNTDGSLKWAMNNDEFREYFSRGDVIRFGREWHTHPLFEGTSFSEGMNRIQRETDKFFASLGYEHDLENNCFKELRPNNDRVALFAHAGFGVAFLSCVLDIPYPLMAIHFDICHTGMTVIKFDSGEKVYPRVLELSSDAHLYKEGLMTGYNNEIRF